MFYQQAPAGNRVIPKQNLDYHHLLTTYFQPYSVQWYNSGTSALSAAVCAVMSLTDIQEPEVLLPAYGCPDLVSAILKAGAKPVLVDLEPDRPWMAITALEEHIHKKTIAIVAVDLFGIPERSGPLRALATAHGLTIIEDSAQYFPKKIDEHVWFGDYIVLSFGRGKPVSLLQGGAVLSRSLQQYQLLPPPVVRAKPWLHRFLLTYHLKAGLYNGLISPYFYWLPEALPFLKLGETYYQTLMEIGAFDENIKACLPENIHAYNDAQKEFVQDYNNIFVRGGDHAKLRPLSIALQETVNGLQLSRYPLLANSRVLRDEVCEQLHRHGVGCSRMYQKTLPKIQSIPESVCRQGPFEHAERFAERLLTLPLHTRITQRDLKKTETIINAL